MPESLSYDSMTREELVILLRQRNEKVRALMDDREVKARQIESLKQQLASAFIECAILRRSVDSIGYP